MKSVRNKVVDKVWDDALNKVWINITTNVRGNVRQRIWDGIANKVWIKYVVRADLL